jgi:cyclic pyranopterin phosphate synthase
MCLGQNDSYPLRAILRAGCSNEDLKQHIVQAIQLKPERHEFTTNPGKVVRFMSYTGG